VLNVAWRHDTRSKNRYTNRYLLIPSLCKSGVVYSSACTSNQPDEIVVSLNARHQKAVDTLAPSRPQRLRARDYIFLLFKKFEKMRLKKRKLQCRFNKSGSAIDFQHYKVFLRVFLRVAKEQVVFLYTKLSSSCGDSEKAFKTAYLLLKLGKITFFSY